MPQDIQLTEPPENTVEECDAVLGAFLRAWDQMHISITTLAQFMLSTPFQCAAILINSGIDHPTLRTLLESLGELRLREPEQKSLASLLRRWKAASTKRNRIVHGAWQLSVRVTNTFTLEGVKRTQAKWHRFYAPADLNKLIPIAKGRDQKLRAAHVFELRDIAEADNNIRALAKDINAFTERTHIRAFESPLPVDFGQFDNVPRQPKA